MRVLITGAHGFLGQNLKAHLAERKDIEMVFFTRDHDSVILPELLKDVDFVFHLAGVNRATSEVNFRKGNVDLTLFVIESLVRLNKNIPILYASSSQALLDNPYGRSKLASEKLLEEYSHQQNAPVFIYRLANIFGKWAKPNYNSAVATFCHNIAHGLPLDLHDPAVELNLIYIDDVVQTFVDVMDSKPENKCKYCMVSPVYKKTVGEVAAQIHKFKENRHTLVTEPVGLGFTRALYSTYISYLPFEAFSYAVKQYNDPRGSFVEMIKTKDSGQVSFFTAHAGVTRGGHYHHSKTEKFLVIKGRARFRFRHIISEEYYEIFTCGDKAEIVETVPGWSHDITNIGDDEMIVALWANEIFDRNHPDTYIREIK